MNFNIDKISKSLQFFFTKNILSKINLEMRVILHIIETFQNAKNIE